MSPQDAGVYQRRQLHPPVSQRGATEAQRILTVISSPLEPSDPGDRDASPWDSGEGADPRVTQPFTTDRVPS